MGFVGPNPARRRQPRRNLVMLSQSTCVFGSLICVSLIWRLCSFQLLPGGSRCRRVYCRSPRVSSWRFLFAANTVNFADLDAMDKSLKVRFAQLLYVVIIGTVSGEAQAALP